MIEFHDFDQEENVENKSKIFKEIFGSMRNKLNTYWAIKAKEILEDEIDKDSLFTANIASYELRKRIKIKHLI